MRQEDNGSWVRQSQSFHVQEMKAISSPAFTNERLFERWVRGNRPIRLQALWRSNRKFSIADRKRTHSRSDARLSSAVDGSESQSDSRRIRRRDRPAGRQTGEEVTGSQVYQRLVGAGFRTAADAVRQCSRLVHLVSQEAAVGRAAE